MSECCAYLLRLNLSVYTLLRVLNGLSGGSVVKNPPANAGDSGSIPSLEGLGRSPGEGNGNPLQCSCLENPMESGGLQSMGLQKSWT